MWYTGNKENARQEEKSYYEQTNHRRPGGCPGEGRHDLDHHRLQRLRLSRGPDHEFGGALRQNRPPPEPGPGEMHQPGRWRRTRGLPPGGEAGDVPGVDHFPHGLRPRPAQNRGGGEGQLLYAAPGEPDAALSGHLGGPAGGHLRHRSGDLCRPPLRRRQGQPEDEGQRQGDRLPGGAGRGRMPILPQLPYRHLLHPGHLRRRGREPVHPPRVHERRAVRGGGGGPQQRRDRGGPGGQGGQAGEHPRSGGFHPRLYGGLHRGGPAGVQPPGV